jgi:hypothetical protein
MDIPPKAQQEMLIRELESVRKHAKNMNERAVQGSLDIGKEKTQFFEKIALTSGGTIALVVSFVGAHAGRLQPPWLLRSALVTLVLSMIGATYRNWRFQFYLHANYVGQYLDAKMKATNGERDCVRSGAVILVDEAGASISIEDSNKRLTEEEKGWQKQLDKFKRQENRSVLVVQITEYATLGLFLLGMVMLVELAWRNF